MKLSELLEVVVNMHTIQVFVYDTGEILYRAGNLEFSGALNCLADCKVVYVSSYKYDILMIGVIR